MNSISAIDAKAFRHVLGHYPTGVCIITAMSKAGVPIGMAVGSFTSVSLDPPLVAFLPTRTSTTWPQIETAGKFCVNVLTSGQLDVCRQFASSGGDKFANVAHRLSDNGSPILDGVVAWIDCELFATHDAGDHVIVLGAVKDLKVERSARPLLFFQGGYGEFSEIAIGENGAA